MSQLCDTNDNDNKNITNGDNSNDGNENRVNDDNNHKTDDGNNIAKSEDNKNNDDNNTNSINSNTYGPLKSSSFHVSEQRFDPIKTSTDAIPSTTLITSPTATTTATVTATPTILPSTELNPNESKNGTENNDNNNAAQLLAQQQLLQQQLLQQQLLQQQILLQQSANVNASLNASPNMEAIQQYAAAMQTINNPLLQQLLLQQLKQQQLSNINYSATDALYQNFVQPNVCGLNPIDLGFGGTSTTLPQYNMSNQAQASFKQNRRFYPFSLFIFHLPHEIDNNSLFQLFLPYGAVACHVMRHEDGSSRGFGFVYFNNQHEAIIARDMMNGYQIGLKRLKVSIKRGEDHMIPINETATNNSANTISNNNNTQ